MSEGKLMRNQPLADSERDDGVAIGNYAPIEEMLVLPTTFTINPERAELLHTFRAKLCKPGLLMTAKKERVLEVDFNKHELRVVSTRESGERTKVKVYPLEDLLQVTAPLTRSHQLGEARRIRNTKFQAHKIVLEWANGRANAPGREPGSSTLEFRMDAVSRANLMQVLRVASSCNIDAKAGLVTVAARPSRLRVFFGSFNLGDAAPPVKLDDWIPKPGSTSTGVPPVDVYVISVQEAGYVPPAPFKSAEDHLFAAFRSHMMVGSRYWEVASLSMLHIRVFVCIRSELRFNVTDIETGREATGVGSVIGNKGGVAVAFKFDQTAFYFVGSHLASGREAARLSKRNQEFYSILKGLHTGQSDVDILNEADYFFFGGDLNYRVDMPREEAVKLIDAGEWDTMWTKDQLRVEMESGAVFRNFCSPRPPFPPTYRCERGCWDVPTKMRIYTPTKNRTPSWTDRVLLRACPSLIMEGEAENYLERYAAHNSIFTSDHSPISAIWAVPLRNPLMNAEAVLRGIPMVPGSLYVSQLTACDLVAADQGSIQPYLIMSSGLAEGCVTDPAASGDSASWNSTFVLPLLTGNEDTIKQGKIMISVFDQDEFSADSSLGQAVIPFRGHIGRTLAFKLPITRKGQVVGVLRGRLGIAVGRSMEMPPYVGDDE